jgi:hypothetical protein
MSEKRGNTGKLKYDFPTEAVMNVQTVTGQWYRVTANHFRSWNGNREYVKPIKQPTHGESFSNVPTKSYTYVGPVYLLGTNKEVDPSKVPPGLVESDEQKDLGKRLNERIK